MRSPNFRHDHREIRPRSRWHRTCVACRDQLTFSYFSVCLTWPNAYPIMHNFTNVQPTSRRRREESRSAALHHPDSSIFDGIFEHPSMTLQRQSYCLGDSLRCGV
ncbi:hypothetical protein EJ03DRAFT_45920 [Teratosphaeria nubilosa]|uniref:Uncharacterized protein n=1 Tax=Teratosphaeria nubilosa TaxID=161662 RepID=A0A6G1LE46_9PEZI|nr:hypothetical protein EJ03DRAFT_45920 [Teratosphaeria nubilosa]